MARFKPGVSGNPAGRPRKAITNFGREARKHLELCLETLLEIAKKGSNKEGLVAVGMLLDRSLGKPLVAMEMAVFDRKLTELSDDELKDLRARMVSFESEQNEAQEAVH